MLLLLLDIYCSIVIFHFLINKTFLFALNLNLNSYRCIEIRKFMEANSKRTSWLSCRVSYPHSWSLFYDQVYSKMSHADIPENSIYDFGDCHIILIFTYSGYSRLHHIRYLIDIQYPPIRAPTPAHSLIGITKSVHLSSMPCVTGALSLSLSLYCWNQSHRFIGIRLCVRFHVIRL